MPSSNRLLWACAFVASFHNNLAASSPLQSTPAGIGTIKYLRTPRAQGDLPLITQAVSWPSNHAPRPAPGDTDGKAQHYELPVVSEVFRHIAMDGNLSPVMPLAPPSATLTSTPPTPTQTVDSTGALQMIGPGIVVAPTLAPTARPEASPSSSGSSSPDTHLYPIPVRKLIIIGSIMGAIIVFTFLAYILLNRRGLGFCRRKKPAQQSWTTFGFTPEGEKGLKEKEKEKALPTPPWLLFSSSFSSHGSTVAPKTPETKATPRAQTKIIDISPDFPRSKFSVTSSDYPYSPPSSNPSFTSALSTMAHEPAVPPPLLTPAEFFCLPSVPDLHSHRHSRIHSEPVFGHVLPTQSQSLATIRSGEHRRSKSVSGLVYIVPPTVCEYPDRKDSGSEWTGSPPSAVGDDLRPF